MGLDGNIGVFYQGAGTVTTEKLIVTGNTFQSSSYILNGGTLSTNDISLINNGELIIDGGTLYTDISGRGMYFVGDGVVHLISGSIELVNGTANDVVLLNSDFTIDGGTVSLLGQVFIG